ncbi:hypothetical protein ACEZCY_14625 [Streptacidiphilus sp. N1-12]|uniref:Uncharacterized protein n=2 Tax=Streptacidiphilus alkalitolerans TaxID=3342712 RepID=A0ABV6V9U5_9ACTN
MNGFQRVVVRALNGTVQIGGRCWRWPWENTKGRQRIGRLLALAFGCWALFRLSTFWPAFGALALAGLLILGYWQALPMPIGESEAEDETEPEAADEPPMLSPAETRQLIIDSARHLAGERQGVHLEQMHAYWSTEGDLGMDLSEFRRWVEQHGVPVRDSLKVSGKTRIGIHLGDLPSIAPRPAAAPPPPTVPDDLLQDW